MSESNILEARLERALEGTEADRIKLLRTLVDLAEGRAVSTPVKCPKCGWPIYTAPHEKGE